MVLRLNSMKAFYRCHLVCLMGMLCVSLAVYGDKVSINKVSIDEYPSLQSFPANMPFPTTSIWIASHPQDVQSMPMMDNGGIVHSPRRIAGGDKDSFEEGEDGIKIPEVTIQTNTTPIGDVPILFILLCSFVWCIFQNIKEYKPKSD